MIHVKDATIKTLVPVLLHYKVQAVKTKWITFFILSIGTGNRQRSESCHRNHTHKKDERHKKSVRAHIVERDDDGVSDYTVFQRAVTNSKFTFWISGSYYLQ